MVPLVSQAINVLAHLLLSTHILHLRFLFIRPTILAEDDLLPLGHLSELMVVRQRRSAFYPHVPPISTDFHHIPILHLLILRGRIIPVQSLFPGAQDSSFRKKTFIPPRLFPPGPNPLPILLRHLITRMAHLTIKFHLSLYTPLLAKDGRHIIHLLLSCIINHPGDRMEWYTVTLRLFPFKAAHTRLPYLRTSTRKEEGETERGR
jgi:hypothetical protein